VNLLPSRNEEIAMRSLYLLVISAALAACAAVPPSPEQTAREQARLETHLAGRTPGQPVSCLPSYRTNDTITISENTILFRDGSTIYRNDPPGGCPGLGRGTYSMITNSTGSTGLCRGDIARIADLTSGVVVGSCSLGDFVPYTRARS